MTTITAACVGVETLVPAAVGVLVLGDGARPGFGALAVAGFLLTSGAAIWLAARLDRAPDRHPELVPRTR